MAKRILNMTAEEMTHATKSELIEAIAGSEGRVLASETIGITIPLLTDVTNAEFAASMGADLILLNMFDVQEPKIMALLEVEKEETVREVKRLTGRMVGINLEPVEESYASDNKETLWEMSAGRYATVENAIQAQKMGVDLIVLTGNPGNGVSNPAIISSLKAISEAVGEKIMLAPGKCMPPVSSAKAGREHHHERRYPPVCRGRSRYHSAAGTGNRAWHHDRICAETDQLCTQLQKADDHIDRNFSGRCRTPIRSNASHWSAR